VGGFQPRALESHSWKASQPASWAFGTALRMPPATDTCAPTRGTVQKTFSISWTLLPRLALSPGLGVWSITRLPMPKNA
jgi:hypothetical protein